MSRFLVRRFVFIPLILVLVNFLGFTYAHHARPLRAERTPLARVEESGSLLPPYQVYLETMLNLDFGLELAIPGSLRSNVPNTFGELLGKATLASLGLLGLTLALSALAGFSSCGRHNHFYRRSRF